jgi:hypothetical protein
MRTNEYGSQVGFADLSSILFSVCALLRLIVITGYDSLAPCPFADNDRRNADVRLLHR